LDRCGFETEKVRGGRGLRWPAGRVRVRSVRVRCGSGHNFWNSCGCGTGGHKNFNPHKDSN